MEKEPNGQEQEKQEEPPIPEPATPEGDGERQAA